MRKISLVLCLVLALAMVLTACEPNPGTSSTPSPSSTATDLTPDMYKKAELELGWWTNDARTAATLATTEKYTALHPDITFQHSYASWADYWNQMAAKASSKTLPDVMQHDYAQIANYVDANQLLDLAPYVDGKVLDLSDFSESAIGLVVDGQIWGISLGTNAMAMVYNKAVTTDAGVTIPQAGYTWDNLKKDGQKIKDATGFKTSYLIKLDPKFTVEYYARQKGYQMFNEANDGFGFPDKSIIQEVYQLQADLINGGYSMNDADESTATNSSADDILVRKVTWNEPLWSNQIVAIYSEMNKQQEGYGDNLELAIMPGATGKGVYIKPSMMFSVAANSKNPVQSAAFISWFVNDLDLNTTVLKGERGVPAAKKVRDELQKSATGINPKIYAFIDTVGKDGNSAPIGAPEPEIAPRITAVIKSYFDQICANNGTNPADAATAAWNECQAIFNE